MMSGAAPPLRGAAPRVWLFDLDNTLHDAGAWVFGQMHIAISAYIQHGLALTAEQADALRSRYWRDYGATLLGLVRHHGVDAAHFLHSTHQLPGLEAAVSGDRHDLAALARLPGRRVVVTNAPRAYTLRVLGALGAARCFDAVVSIEDMHLFGHLRPKPDARMFRMLAVRLRVAPAHCVLVEDTLEHQKAARRVGMRTVWMQRYARRGAHAGPRVARWSMRPAYVDLTVRSLVDLVRRRRCLPAPGHPVAA